MATVCPLPAPEDKPGSPYALCRSAGPKPDGGGGAATVVVVGGMVVDVDVVDVGGTVVVVVDVDVVDVGGTVVVVVDVDVVDVVVVVVVDVVVVELPFVVVVRFEAWTRVEWERSVLSSASQAACPLSGRAHTRRKWAFGFAEDAAEPEADAALDGVTPDITTVTNAATRMPPAAPARRLNTL